MQTLRSATPLTFPAVDGKRSLINPRLRALLVYLPALFRHLPTFLIHFPQVLHHQTRRVLQAKTTRLQNPLMSKRFTVCIFWDNLLRWKFFWLICLGYRPHLLNRRSWTSADVRLPLGCQSPWYPHCSFAKHWRNKRCHGFDHAHHNPLFACHCHWSWRPRSSRASPSASIQGRCEDQGRDTQYSGSSNSPVIRQGEGGCCLGEHHPHGSLEEDARRLPLTIELTHSLKSYLSSVWADSKRWSRRQRYVMTHHSQNNKA